MNRFWCMQIFGQGGFGGDSLLAIVTFTINAQYVFLLSVVSKKNASGASCAKQGAPNFCSLSHHETLFLISFGPNLVLLSAWFSSYSE